MNWFYRSLRSKRNPQDRLWVVVVCRYVRATDNADCWLTALFGGCSFRGRSMFLKGQPACTQRESRRGGFGDPIQVASILHIVCWSGTVQWRNESASFPKRLYLPADRINWVSSSYTITSPAASKITSNYRWRWRWNLLKYLPCCRFWLILYIWISSFTLLNSWVCLILHVKVASTVLL